MGGSGGSTVSQIDLSKLTAAAEERLKQLAKSGARLLFACETVDRKSLESHLSRSKVFNKGKIAVFDASEEATAQGEIEKCSSIIIFTDATKTAGFLDKIVETALAKKKQGIHARGQKDALIPSKAMAYRWPSLEWDKLEEMFK
jgi:hypothetical protein